MAQKLVILFTTLLVVMAAHNSLYSTKVHVMAQEDIQQIARKLLQEDQDPVCGKPCNTHDDCSDAWLCQACWNFRQTCGPFVG
ncbi:metallocarboxypeptidase inhibitor-like [Solanum pennellii]|uniref:Metallocarboxypeptidase inhibitor-like n=1 Tax=Solanum pennellii TaxID=28526 RepID=A0ABM1H7W0_SOLPN|nr:metallocarboxypeptidase inhibitor-like [Solanum pennellii]